MDGEMNIKGYVDQAEVDAKLGGNDNRAFIAKVAKGMQENPGKCPDLDVGVKTMAEAKKKVNQLNKQRYKMGSEYLKMVFVLAGKDDSDFRVFAMKCEPVKKKSGKKNDKKNSGPAPVEGNGKKPKAQKQDIHEAPGQTKNLTDMKEQMLKSIESMPVQMLPMVLAQYQGMLTAKQQALAAPDIKEEAAAKIKEEIQVFEEIIAAIKKKMGQ
jgi:hypothetical protein